MLPIFRKKSNVHVPPRSGRSQGNEFQNIHDSSSRNVGLRDSAHLLNDRRTSQQAHHHPCSEVNDWEDLLGQPVCISGVKEGILRYYGRTKFADGLWCGVDLNEPVGKNNGIVGGVRYFHCKPNHGIFAPVTKVSLLLPNQRDHRKRAFVESNQSCHSRTDILTQDAKIAYLRQSASDPAFEKQPIRQPCLNADRHNVFSDSRCLTELRDTNPDKNNGNEQSVLYCSRSSINSDNSTLPTVVDTANAQPRLFSDNKVLHTESNVENTYFRAPQHDFMHFPRKVMSEYTLSHHSNTNAASVQSHSCPHSTLNLKGPSVESIATRRSSNTVPPERQSRVFPELDFKKNRHSSKNSFESPELFDFQWDNDDDPVSLDFDESLGILTPSQMKDFTFCGDMPTSCSDTRAFDFPSSESFDDVNDLPEDEQVHDLAVHYVSSSAASKLIQSKSYHAEASSSAMLTSNNAPISDLKQNSGAMHNTTNFLRSITSNRTLENYADYSNVENATDSKKLTFATLASCSSTSKFRERCNDQAFRAHNSYNLISQFAVSEKDNNNAMSFSSCQQKEAVSMMKMVTAKQNEQPEAEIFENPTAVEQFSSSPRHREDSSSSIKSRRRGETSDTSQDSLIPSDFEGMVASKEKLSVSWDDCVVEDAEHVFSKVERPESVYTVGSNDTGFQEDGEFDGDLGMTTSMESEEGKRFSGMCRDSCVLVDDVDTDKVGESNSTSGYSTGLSDSCCNDRQDEESSRRHMEDSFQDVADYGNCEVVPLSSHDSTQVSESCHSSFQAESFGFFDNDSHLDSTLKLHITESNTIQSLDSTCEALSETITEASLSNGEVFLNSHQESPMPASNKLSSAQNDINGISIQHASSISEYSNVVQETKREVDTADGQCAPKQKVGEICIEESNTSKSNQEVKSPKRNVMSKIKTVIGGYTGKSSNTRTKPESDQIAGKKCVSVPKKSRWDAVTSKIAASLAEEKTKPKTKKDVKSKVDTNLSGARQSCMSPNLSTASDKKLDISVSSSTSSKSRRTMERRNQIRNQAASKPPLQVSSHCGRNPRPIKNYSTSRSTSPVAPSDSSSASSVSHPSRAKIPPWKGSNSTVASSIPQLQPKKSVPKVTVMNRNEVRQQNSDASKARLSCGKSSAPAQNNYAASARVSLKPEPVNKTSNMRVKTVKEQSGGSKPIVAPRPVRPPMWLSKAELSQEIQHLSTLCEGRTKELNKLKLDTKHVTMGFDALAVVIRYMASDLNAFQNPTLAADLKNAQEKLNRGRKDLDFYEIEIEKLKVLHGKEIQDLSESLRHEHELKVKDLVHRHHVEITCLKEQQEKELRILQEALKQSCEEERLQLEKIVDDLQQELRKQREELEIFHQHELDDLEERLTDKQRTLQAELEKVQKQYEDAKILSQTMEEALNRDTDSKLQWISCKKVDLQNEVDSLKAVLEIKNNELHSLRKDNLEMQKELEELPLAREKIKMLKARAEDLKALMAEKVRIERRLSTEHQTMKEIYEKETKVNKRLSMENEELQWKLKQASESSLLSASIPDMNEMDSFDYSNNDSVIEIEVESKECFSPARSPHPSSSRPVFFTYMNQEELSALSPQSPRTQYKRIQPGSHKHTSPVSKLFSSPSPRKSRGIHETSSQSHEGTPCKLAKHISRTTADESCQRQRASSAEDRVIHESHHITLDEQTTSVEENIASNTVIDENSVLAKSEEVICGRGNGEFVGLASASNGGQVQVNKTEEGSETVEQTHPSEAIDPKTYYHMTFPVFKEKKSGDGSENETKSEDCSPEERNACDNIESPK